jgi:hypothetical protein
MAYQHRETEKVDRTITWVQKTEHPDQSAVLSGLTIHQPKQAQDSMSSADLCCAPTKRAGSFVRRSHGSDPRGSHTPPCKEHIHGFSKKPVTHRVVLSTD